ncbi:dUTP diphosphatase [Paenibacillus glucanolyticus]
MTLTIEQMYEMQKELDAKIIREKGLEGQDLLQNTVLALQVEIGELANEWRGFKHWSNRQTPKMFPLEMCDYCGEEVSFTRPSPFMADSGADMCEECWNMTKKEYAASNGEYIPDFKDYPHFPKKTPQKMLEEYVDCLHFFLSLARQLDLPADDLFGPETGEDLKGETAQVFTEILYHVGGVGLHKHEDIRRKALQLGLWIFYTLGEQRLGFTFEQIAEAYAAKNAVNHQRQANGY